MTKISNLYTLTNYITANSSGNVVIAAPASGYALDVTGTGRFTGALTGTSATFSSSVRTIRLDAYGSGTNDLLFLDAGVNTDFAYKIVSGADDAFVLRRQHNTQGGLDIMSWTYSGKVGIGTTSPTGLLHLYGADPAFRIQSSTTGNMQFGQWDGTYNRIQGSGRDFLLINTDATNILLSTNSSERMRITSSGNVGIGTTSPDAIFHVAKVNSGGLGGQIVIDNPATSTLGNSVEISFLTDAGASGAGTRNARIIAQNENANNGAANMQFWTWNGGTDTERMRITSGGVLQLGNGAAQNNVFKSILEDSTNYETQFYNSNNKNAFKIGGGASGTYNDGATISLTGSDRYGASTAGMLILSAGNASNNTSFGTIEFRTANTERMRITYGGQVLIGQTTASGSTNGIYFRPGIESGFIVTNDIALQLGRLGSTGDIQSFYTGTTRVGTISVSGSATSYNTTSDYRLKEDLQPAEGLKIVDRINVYNYKWKSSDERMDGVLAHELSEVLPYAVMGEKDGEYMQGVDYSKIVPILIQSIKELSAKVTALENK